MKTLAKLGLGAALACGVTLAAAAPAAAGVYVGVGVPAYYGANTCYDVYGQPYYCGYPAGYVGFGFGGWHGHGGYYGHGGYRGGVHGGGHRR